jgi:hypothetical protein
MPLSCDAGGEAGRAQPIIKPQQTRGSNDRTRCMALWRTGSSGTGTADAGNSPAAHGQTDGAHAACLQRLVRRSDAHPSTSIISGLCSLKLTVTTGLITAKTSKPRMSRIARIKNIRVIREIRGQTNLHLISASLAGVPAGSNSSPQILNSSCWIKCAR